MSPVARWSLALLLPLFGCTPPDGAATDATDAGLAVDVPTDLTPADRAPAVDAPAADVPLVDPCDLRAEVAVRLRDPVDVTQVLATLPAGTAYELLAVTDLTRGPLARLGVLSRVRVRATGAEGFVYVAAEAARRCQELGATEPDVRESRRVVVDGVEEVWRVRFVTPSRAPEPLTDEDRSCPARFDARFDRGRAVIERLRGGAVIDRFENPCGRDDGDECARRLLVPWRVDPRPGGLSSPPAALAAMPWVTLLDVGDYDHDGRATEFAMDVGHLVCGHERSVVVGVTRDRPRLHVLTWSDGEPMALEWGSAAWERVRASARGEMVTWGCGDHGADAEERVRWRPARGGLAHEEFTVPMDETCRPRAAAAEEEVVLEAGE